MNVEKAHNRKARILIIEDDCDCLSALGEQLSTLDATVIRAASGKEGLSRLKQSLPDVVLIEIDLKDLPAIDVCRRIKAHPRTAEIPVIFITDSERRDDIIDIFEAGGLDCVTRPIDGPILRARVESALRMRTLIHRLGREATTDMLTGLPNRATLLRQVDRRIRLLETGQRPAFAILFLDFDRFKIVNDSLGHEAGDLLLLQIAERLSREIENLGGGYERYDDHLVSRLGGDEFVVILDDVNGRDAATYTADRLLERLAAPYELLGTTVTSTASIGIVLSGRNYDSAADMLRDADTALYRAKAEGRARHAFFDMRMHTEATEHLQLEADLRKALEANEFDLEYQPIICLKTGELSGFESLIRWNHPTRGRLSPDLFIPMAEELGLIVPMGEWVLLQSCRQIHAWRQVFGDRAPDHINVNVSKKQFAAGNFTDVVCKALKVTACDPEAIQLEITESVIMEFPWLATTDLAEIRALGVRTCMDDFGKGLSSLSCLHKFPLDILKIDRDFIANTEGRREYAAINNAIITLAHHLEMGVVAEGVETQGQLAQLQALGCDYGQGYFFSRPVSADVATEFIEHGGARQQSA